MSDIIKLDWDSHFLGFKTGKIILNDLASLSSILTAFQNGNYQLIYGYSDFQINDLEILKKLNGKLVDKKVTLSCDLDKKSFIQYDDIVDVETINDDLIGLSLESGNYSRFKLDENFGLGVFEKMYTLWIENSVARKIANHVLVASNNKGMLTLKHSDEISTIGLLAVNQNSRGEKIGSKLMSEAKRIAVLNRKDKLEVVTQLDNETAMKFYKHNGFVIDKVEFIYHFWLK